MYTAYIQGNFFADAQVRWDFYESSSSSRIFDYSGVKNDARGLALTGSLGYRIPLVSDWFIEPSVGASWSRVKVDPVALIDSAGPFTGDGGFVRIDDIDSVLGRASLRVGTNIVQGAYIWQPFVSASVVREFAGKVTSSTTLVQPGSTLNGIVFDTSTERFGTYAQFGVGTALVLGNTGWLGYSRVDYRIGDNIEGVGLNAGLRYHW